LSVKSGALDPTGIAIFYNPLFSRFRRAVIGTPARPVKEIEIRVRS
jgi:hypothetical protein